MSVFFNPSDGSFKDVVSGTLRPMSNTFYSTSGLIFSILSRFDKDKDGALSIQEMRALMKVLNDGEDCKDEVIIKEMNTVVKSAGLQEVKNNSIPLVALHAFWFKGVS
jgi:hypothetical protein